MIPNNNVFGAQYKFGIYAYVCSGRTYFVIVHLQPKLVHACFNTYLVCSYFCLCKIWLKCFLCDEHHMIILVILDHFLPTDRQEAAKHLSSFSTNYHRWTVRCSEKWYWHLYCPCNSPTNECFSFLSSHIFTYILLWFLFTDLMNQNCHTNVYNKVASFWIFIWKLFLIYCGWSCAVSLVMILLCCNPCRNREMAASK